ncbi:MAG TPA: TraR/DksA family transcriptional regulator [Bryobacteraceae bacterium]|nr:TraR/DksA family transcriptional regulator [Bryobacteraceae bacterium]
MCQLRSSSGLLATVEKPAEDDQARVLHDQFVALRLGRLAYGQLKSIDAALARLDAGSYGTCVDCESAIPPKRLAAIPWANRCIACQEQVALQPDHELLARSAA